jgi:penicillin amidase
MDLDRHKAYGRSAELLGPSAVDNDVLVRRMRLEASARADYVTLNAPTRAMLDAYAEGVNAFMASTGVLGIEYRLLGVTPEPWTAHDSLAVFKIRHVFMGTFEFKLWRAKLLAKLGPETTARLFPSAQPGGLVIIPPDAQFEGEAAHGREILASSQDLTRLLTAVDGGAGDAGSNSWAIHGSRTATGKPLLAGDPHRAPDTPNVYYQNHIACPDFDVIGLSFAGLPGFLHFGHSRNVAWCVTHTAADYQDLYVERFKPGDPTLYEFKGEWRKAKRYQETIAVRGAPSVPIDVVVTHHGPVIMASPDMSLGVAFKYTATAEAAPWAESLLDMMLAENADAFEAAMRPWVDPCNNILCADTRGNISYQMRGKLPVRSRANAWVPVPGWTGEHEWSGIVPFDEAPRTRNPDEGFIVTANNRVIGASYPHYISMDFAPDYRASRIVSRLSQIDNATVDDMAAIHADRVSLLARRLLPALANLTPASELTTAVLARLATWDCAMDHDRVEPTIYSAIVAAILRNVSLPLVGEALTDEALAGTSRGGPAHIRGLKGIFASMIESGESGLLPEGMTWDTLLTTAVTEAVAWLRETLGDDIDRWQWGVLHRTKHVHPLSPLMPEHASTLNPPTVAIGGDAETPQAATYAPARPFTVTSTSVARYVYDLSDWTNSRWVVPLGSSGHPGSPHYADQMERWAEIGMYPMLYEWAEIEAGAETTQELRPQ